MKTHRPLTLLWGMSSTMNFSMKKVIIGKLFFYKKTSTINFSVRKVFLEKQIHKKYVFCVEEEMFPYLFFFYFYSRYEDVFQRKHAIKLNIF